MGPAERIQTAARHQSAAHRLHRRACARSTAGSCSTWVAAAAFFPKAWLRAERSVTGIDLADKPLKIAQLHLIESGLEVRYRKISAEDLALEKPQYYDIVTCLEVLEHVPDPASTVEACAKLLRPGGHAFFATINRNAKAFLLAIVGAEYLLRLLPRGTHEYAKLIKPSELGAMCRKADLTVADVIGMTYNPLTRIYAMGRDTGVNYIVHARAA